MTAVWIIMVIFGSLVVLMATICGTILLAMKIKHGGLSARSRETQGEETRMIQEIYQGLSRMEARVEALETILMERREKRHDDQG